MATQKQQAQDFWSAHIEQWQSSGFSQAGYCRQHGLCEQKFSYRKRRLCLIEDKANTSAGFARIQIDNSPPDICFSGRVIHTLQSWHLHRRHHGKQSAPGAALACHFTMTGIMRPFALSEVYLYRQPVDFRKSYRGLSAIVECELGHNPFQGHLHVFSNKQRNKIKLLFWENNGFVLYYKALVEDKFNWPKADKETLILTGQQLNWLLDGLDIEAMTGHKKLHFESVF